jgi:hypothetical protein
MSCQEKSTTKVQVDHSGDKIRNPNIARLDLKEKKLGMR